MNEPSKLKRFEAANSLVIITIDERHKPETLRSRLHFFRVFLSLLHFTTLFFLVLLFFYELQTPHNKMCFSSLLNSTLLVC